MCGSHRILIWIHRKIFKQKHFIIEDFEKKTITYIRNFKGRTIGNIQLKLKTLAYRKLTLTFGNSINFQENQLTKYDESLREKYWVIGNLQEKKNINYGSFLRKQLTIGNCQ